MSKVVAGPKLHRLHDVLVDQSGDFLFVPAAQRQVVQIPGMLCGFTAVLYVIVRVRIHGMQEF